MSQCCRMLQAAGALLSSSRSIAAPPHTTAQCYRSRWMLQAAGARLSSHSIAGPPTQQLSAEVIGLRHLYGLRDVGAGWFGVLKLEPQFSLPCCRLLSVNVVIVVQRCQSKPCLHPLGTEHFPLWDILYVEGMDALQIASVYALCHLLKIIFK